MKYESVLISENRILRTIPICDILPEPILKSNLAKSRLLILYFFKCLIVMEYTTKHDIAITISCAKLKKIIILCMTLRSDFKIRFQNGIKCRNTSMDSGLNVPERVLRCTYISIVVIRRCWRLTFFNSFIAWCVNYNAVIMGAMASQITSLVNVYTIVYSWGRWIPRTKGQWRGKSFHLMT